MPVWEHVLRHDSRPGSGLRKLSSLWLISNVLLLAPELACLQSYTYEDKPIESDGAETNTVDEKAKDCI